MDVVYRIHAIWIEGPAVPRKLCEELAMLEADVLRKECLPFQLKHGQFREKGFE